MVCALWREPPLWLSPAGVGFAEAGEGFSVNKKRVHRLWREEGLKVPRKQRKRRRGWARARTDAPEDGPSTKTTCGATTSSWTKPRTAVG